MSGPTQRGDETELFARHHEMLLRAVARQASAPAVVIEDACGFAWAQLLRYQPQRDNIVGWLVTVAVHEAWRLSRRQRAEISGEVEASDAYAHLEHIGATLDDQVAAREALRAVAELPERQRHLLARQAAGLSHDELAADTGDSMRTIDRQLGRARARIREAGVRPESPPLLRGVELISYNCAPAAVAGATRMWLAPAIDDLPRGHPLRRFVAAMCMYAHDVRHGLVPGPYSDARAELYARCLLLPDRAAAAGADLSDKQLAEAWGMPLEQVRAKRCELGAAGPQ